MKYKNKLIDLSKINSVDELHDALKSNLGFPDFYGNNINALIDCLSGLRYPEEGMIKITLEKNEVLLLTLKSVYSLNEDALYILIGAIQSVNSRQIDKGNSSSIHLNIIK